MTYEELMKANEATKPTDIGKGKDYIEVNQRIKAFRMICPAGTISTSMISNADGICIFRAEVFDENQRLLGTGTAYEKEGSSFINKTSYIENCETSAVGRALAMCGIGIDVSIASKEEVENAKLNQEAKPAKPKTKSEAQKEAVEEATAKAKVMGYINRHSMTQEDIKKLCRYYRIDSLQNMTLENAQHYISAVEKNGGSIDE